MVWRWERWKRSSSSSFSSFSCGLPHVDLTASPTVKMNLSWRQHYWQLSCCTLIHLEYPTSIGLTAKMSICIYLGVQEVDGVEADNPDPSYSLAWAEFRMIHSNLRQVVSRADPNHAPPLLVAKKASRDDKQPQQPLYCSALQDCPTWLNL